MVQFAVVDHEADVNVAVDGNGNVLSYEEPFTPCRKEP